MPRPTPGITIRHARNCPTSLDREARCNCTPTYQAHLWDRRSGRRIRKTFPTIAAAKLWRSDAVPALRRGTMKAPTSTTLRQAWELWLAGAKEGSVRTRSGDRYKPSVLRSYESAMRLRLLDDLGGLKLSDITRPQLQDVADRMLAAGLDPSTIRNALMPLRALFRRASSRGELAVNPTTGLELPAVRGKRDRIASPAEASKLLDALPEHERALWATAAYAGLRLGELRALRFEDVDLEAGVIRVERSWDQKAGVIEPKSRAGRRSVPIVAALRAHLAAHLLRSTRRDGLIFGRTVDEPFNPGSVNGRAARAWAVAAVGAFLSRPSSWIEIEAIGLHELRHTCASIFIAAGVNAKALSTYLGHSSVTITYDRYGHLMPGNEAEAVSLVDAYLERETVRTMKEAVHG